MKDLIESQAQGCVCAVQNKKFRIQPVQYVALFCNGRKEAYMSEKTNFFSCAKSYVDHNLSRILFYKHHLSLFQEMGRGCCLAFVQQSCSSVLCCIGLFSEGLSSQLSRFNLKMCILKVWNVLNLNTCRIGMCFIVNYGCLCSLIVCVFYFVTLSISKSILISYIFIDEK